MYPYPSLAQAQRFMGVTPDRAAVIRSGRDSYTAMSDPLLEMQRECEGREIDLESTWFKQELKRELPDLPGMANPNPHRYPTGPPQSRHSLQVSQDPQPSGPNMKPTSGQSRTMDAEIFGHTRARQWGDIRPSPTRPM